MRVALLTLVLMGCLKPVPLPPEPPHVVVVVQVPEPPPLVIVEEPDAGPPVKTWLTGEELQQVLDERHRQAVTAGQECDDGDPLCEVIP